MRKSGLRYSAIGALLIIWLSVTIPNLISFLGKNSIIFPLSLHSDLSIYLMLISCVILSIIGIMTGILEIRETEGVKYISREKLFPAIFLLFICIPISYAYIFEQNNHNISQLILDSGVMDEDFDEVVPGEDPPGWSEESGDWYAVDDGGNMVYYNDDDADAEALTISTTGDTSWTDYTFTVDVKFIEGPVNKANRGALIVYRYTSGNDYYYLAMREAQDVLEVYKHGSDSVGHRVGSVSCTLVQDTWYSVNITIRSNNVWISVDDNPYFTKLDMQGAHSQGSIGIGTKYYKVMFDNIYVELK